MRCFFPDSTCLFLKAGWGLYVMLQSSHGHTSHSLNEDAVLLDLWGASITVRKRVLIYSPFLIETLVTDASMLGWEAHLSHWQIQGPWASQESTISINVLELRVIWLSCKVFLPPLKRVTLHIVTHSTLLCTTSTGREGHDHALCVRKQSNSVLKPIFYGGAFS